MLYLTKTPAVLKKLFPKALWNMERDEKSIYLTFDDGPTVGVTDEVLNLMDEYGAKGSFFCLGRQIELNGALFEETKLRGHCVGNHGFMHLNSWKSKKATYLEDVEACSKLCPSPYFRPPYGKIKPSHYGEIKKHFRMVMWDVLAGDFDPGVPKERCLKNVIENGREGSIVVFHDSQKAKEKMLYALKGCLEHFSALGYQFKALPC